MRIKNLLKKLFTSGHAPVCNRLFIPESPVMHDIYQEIYGNLENNRRRI